MTKSECVRDFGQLFMMALDGPRIPADLAEFFRTFRIGGIILFSDNYENPQQLRELTSDLQRLCSSPELPLFIATDHEGGSVQRFTKGFTIIPPMANYGSGPPGETERVHRLISAELLAAGVNFNLSPVADLSSRDAVGAIGDRSFGSDPTIVSRHVVAAMRGLLAGGVLGCVKHFPGHGSTPVDSRKDLPSVPLTRDEIEPGLEPFRAVIAAGVPAIMTAHILYPNAGDPDWPVSLSSYWLSDTLRRDLGFSGLIITDAIEMKSLSTRWTPEFCGDRALRAGADILLYYKEAHQFQAFDKLLRALEKGELEIDRVAESLGRVFEAKRRFLTHTAGL